MSESIGAIAAALAKAQGMMGAAVKDKVNPHLKNKYADLTSVWEACREPLSANGLAVVQLVQAATPDSVAVETRLLHSSGESLSSLCVVPVAQKTAQGIGSAITYARRYGLSAMVGVTADDDDGHAASTRGTPNTQSVGPAVFTPRSTPPARDVDPLTAEVHAVRQAIAEAATKTALQALTKRLAALPEADKAALRVEYGKRLAEVSR